MNNGYIYDVDSITKFVEEFSSNFNNETVRFSKRKKIGDKIFDADTVASNGMFLNIQLQAIIPQILEQVYPDLVGLEIMKGKIDNSNTYMQAIIQRIQAYEGDFVDASELSDDNGLITFARDGKAIDIRTKKAYSIYDNVTANRAKMLGENIDSSLIEGHNIKYKQFIDNMIFLGMTDSRKNQLTEGLANYTNYLTFTDHTQDLRLDSLVPFKSYLDSQDGWGIISQIEALATNMDAAAGGASQFKPDTLIVPVEQYSILSRTPLVTIGTNPSIGTPDTVLKWLERNYDLKIYRSKWLQGQGDGGSDRLILFASKETANPNAKLYIPMPLQFLPLFIKAGDIHIHSQFRVAGVSINFNNAIAYLDHI